MQNYKDGVSETQEEIHTMKEKYNEKIKEYTNKSEDVVKRPWTNAAVEKAIRDILDSANPVKKKTSRQYALIKKYDTMEIGKKVFLIKKQKTAKDPAIIIIPVEEYFDTLLECHRATEHGGRDKMLLALKNKFYVPRPAVEIFVSLCKACNKRKSLQHRNVGQVVAKDYNLRCRFDVIDLQSTPCGDYRWLLNYQDLATNFCILRPLKTNGASEVASELLKTFYDFGPPKFLHSRQEFTTELTKQLSSTWPDCNIVKAQHIEDSSSQDIVNSLRAWMATNDSSDWVIGCRCVQRQKNTSKDKTTGQSPYKAVFGIEPKIELAGKANEENPRQTDEVGVKKEKCSVCFDYLDEASYTCSCCMEVDSAC